MSPRPTARYPSPRPGPHRQLPNEGVAKNGELLGPKVKAQLALEARGHVPNADDGSAFVRFGTDSELLIYVSSQLLFLRAEHLDVGFMLSGFRRRHKVSQRSVRVLERLPRRERRVSKGAPERERLGTNSTVRTWPLWRKLRSATCASPRTGASWRRCAWSARTSARSMKCRLNSP